MHWLRSLQNARLYAAARNLIIAWTLVCALGLIAGLLNILNALPAPLVQSATSQVVTVSFWAAVWVYPTAGLLIIAFVAKPRVKPAGGR